MNKTIFFNTILSLILFSLNAFAEMPKQDKLKTLIETKLANHYYVDSNLVKIDLDDAKTKELCDKITADISDVRVVRIDERLNKFLATIYTVSDIYYTEGKFKFVNMKPVAKKNITRDQILEKDDVEFQKEYVDNIKQVHFTASTELLGYKAKVHISQNNAITKDHLEKAYIIKKNEQVQVVYKNKNINIKTTATAQEDGAIGDYIKIKSDTDIFLKGKVTNSKMVEIE